MGYQKRKEGGCGGSQTFCDFDAVQRLEETVKKAIISSLPISGNVRRERGWSSKIRSLEITFIIQYESQYKETSKNDCLPFLSHTASW